MPDTQSALALAGADARPAIKAVSFWQPWASLVAAKLKRYETRTWWTSYRGRLAIHAAARPPVRDLDPELMDLLARKFGRRWCHDLPRGAVVCLADLIDCIPTAGATPDPLEKLCGNWTPGRQAWHLVNIEPLNPPVPARGKQGFWTWRR